MAGSRLWAGGIAGQSTLFQGMGNLLTTLWTLRDFLVAGQSSQEELEEGGLLGDTTWGARLALGVVALFVLRDAVWTRD